MAFFSNLGQMNLGEINLGDNTVTSAGFAGSSDGASSLTASLALKIAFRGQSGGVSSLTASLQIISPVPAFTAMRLRSVLRFPYGRWDYPDKALIDRSSSLAQGLVFLLIPTVHPAMNLVGGHGLTLTGGTLTTTPRARGLTICDFQFAAADTAELNFTTPDWTVAVWYSLQNFDAALANGSYTLLGRYGYASESSNNGWQIDQRKDDASHPLFGSSVYNNCAYTSYGHSCENLRSAGDHCIIFSTATIGEPSVNAERFIVLDAVPVIQAWISGLNRTAGSSTGVLQNTKSASEWSEIYAVAAWNRALYTTNIYPANPMCTNEIEELIRSPLCMLARPAPLWWTDWAGTGKRARYYGFWGINAAGSGGSAPNLGAFGR